MNTTERNRNTKATAQQPEDAVRVDGFAQVIQLLQVADSGFRDSLLKRLESRDPALARSIREYLAKN